MFGGSKKGNMFAGGSSSSFAGGGMGSATWTIRNPESGVALQTQLDDKNMQKPLGKTLVRTVPVAPLESEI